VNWSSGSAHTPCAVVWFWYSPALLSSAQQSARLRQE
jgi:hypothetical protein